jgi:hypothetical protein
MICEWRNEYAVSSRASLLREAKESPKSAEGAQDKAKEKKAKVYTVHKRLILLQMLLPNYYSSQNHVLSYKLLSTYIFPDFLSHFLNPCAPIPRQLLKRAHSRVQQQPEGWVG